MNAHGLCDLLRAAEKRRISSMVNIEMKVYVYRYVHMDVRVRVWSPTSTIEFKACLEVLFCTQSLCYKLLLCFPCFTSTVFYWKWWRLTKLKWFKVKLLNKSLKNFQESTILFVSKPFHFERPSSSSPSFFLFLFFPFVDCL